MARGDHIYVKRVTYSHHGIEVDDNYVVHFSGEPSSKNGARIKITSMKEFHCGDRIQKVLYSANIPYSKNEIVNRAYARLGETSYDVVFNNCEHFARWCATNEHKSEQVKNICSSASGTAGTTAITSTAIGSVAIAGAVPGLSGAGIMSGLAAIGPGGVIGGIATLSTAPAIISNIAMNNILEDDKSLSDEERESRLSNGAKVFGHHENVIE